MTKPLKPCLPEYQNLSDKLMAMHIATLRAVNAIEEAKRALEDAVPALVADGVLIAEIHAKGFLPLAKLALIHSQGRAAHYGMSKVLPRLGYDYPVSNGALRGPGGGR